MKRQLVSRRTVFESFKFDDFVGILKFQSVNKIQRKKTE